MEDKLIIDRLIDILTKNELSEIKFQDKDFKINIKKDYIIVKMGKKRFLKIVLK